MRSGFVFKRQRERISKLYAGMMTVTGARQRGFFTPYPYMASILRDPPAYPAIEEIFDRARPGFTRRLDQIRASLERFENLVADPGVPDPRTPVLGRGMFPPLDGAVAHAMIAELRPRRIVEVGSGDSTFILRQGVIDARLDCEIICIDPRPRRSVEALQVTLRRRALSLDDVELASTLGPGDVLFIDSSHLMLPGIDVDILFNRMFPLLAPGVAVHVHDIFLPFDYPPEWWPRHYSEQPALIGWLVSGYFDVLMPTHYLQRSFGSAMSTLGARFPVLAGRGAGSLWLRRADRGAGDT